MFLLYDLQPTLLSLALWKYAGVNSRTVHSGFLSQRTLDSDYQIPTFSTSIRSILNTVGQTAAVNPRSGARLRKSLKKAAGTWTRSAPSNHLVSPQPAEPRHVHRGMFP